MHRGAGRRRRPETGTGSELVDAARPEAARQRGHGGKGSGEQEPEVLVASGRELADAADRFLPLEKRRPQGRTGLGPTGSGFPPPRAGADAEWIAVLERHPELAPAFDVK